MTHAMVIDGLDSSYSNSMHQMVKQWDQENPFNLCGIVEKTNDDVRWSTGEWRGAMISDIEGWCRVMM